MRYLKLAERAWWRSAVIYQIYPRSYADGSGDGVGDLAGIRARLGHLAALGVDAVWFSPWYASPMADAGYDVADYRAIDPLAATLSGDVSPTVRESAARGLGLIASPSALPALQRAAQADGDRDVRRSAQFAADVIQSKN